MSSEANDIIALDPEGWHPLLDARPDWFEVIHLYGTKSGWERLKELVNAHEDSVARHQAFVDRIAPRGSQHPCLLARPKAWNGTAKST